jgi:hypothetical protein
MKDEVKATLVPAVCGSVLSRQMLARRCLPFLTLFVAMSLGYAETHGANSELTSEDITKTTAVCRFALPASIVNANHSRCDRLKSLAPEKLTTAFFSGVKIHWNSAQPRTVDGCLIG